ncbi:hypothetical protein H5410_053279, partial [Solanum commersonii]
MGNVGPLVRPRMASLDGRCSSFAQFSNLNCCKVTRLPSPSDRASNNGQPQIVRYCNLGMASEKSTCCSRLHLTKCNTSRE